MRISVLASGSKGNCTFVEENDTRILVDFGISSDYVEEQLDDMNVDVKTIKAVLITHTHSDHVNGLIKFCKKYNPSIYIMPKMFGALKAQIGDFRCEYFNKEDTIIDNILINIVKTSHDVEDSVGFILNKKVVYLTDTGYINVKYFEMLENKEMYIIESNHDLEMLIDGKYPHFLKQRILSDRGHLSNQTTSLYLSKLIGKKTKHIILAHLSEENNMPEKALEALFEKIDKKDFKNIIVAEQNCRTKIVEL
ncbi:MAG: MBL fold metallo-hydrolase [Bacilli bacterium]|nr:MBL fold metallo-hydrolase [Bacilli bacterium]